MKYLLVLFFTFLTLNAFAQESFTYYGSSNVDATSYPKVTQIEKQLFKRSYSQDIYQRLDRIEQRLYHQNFPNMSLADRIDRITSQINKNSLSPAYISALNNIEKQVYNKVNTGLDLDSRISNLEMSLIGAIQSGEYEDRIQQLKAVADNTCPSMFSLGGMSSSSTYYSERQSGTPYNNNNSGYSPSASPRGLINDILTIFGRFLGRGYNSGYGYNNGYGNNYYNPNRYNSIYPNNSYSAPNNYNYSGNYNGSYMPFNYPRVTSESRYYDSSIGVKILD